MEHCTFAKKFRTMPHGDFSDFSAISCLAFGVASIYYPALWFQGYGPLTPMLKEGASDDAVMLVRLIGGLFVCLAPSKPGWGLREQGGRSADTPHSSAYTTWRREK